MLALISDMQLLQYLITMYVACCGRDYKTQGMHSTSIAIMYLKHLGTTLIVVALLLPWCHIFHCIPLYIVLVIVHPITHSG